MIPTNKFKINDDTDPKKNPKKNPTKTQKIK